MVARRERGGQAWFVGAITDEEGRTLDVPLSFLTPGRRYVAEIYADGPGRALAGQSACRSRITRRTVTAASRLRVVLAPGGRSGDPHPAGAMTGACRNPQSCQAPVSDHRPHPLRPTDTMGSPAATASAFRPKPRLSFWEIWNMSFGFLGIQFGFALQNANVSRIFETLGARWRTSRSCGSPPR